MVDNILPEHVELPYVLDLAVHLDQLTTWIGRGGNTVIIVSAPVPIGLGFGFGTALGLGFGLRGLDLGLGLDNKKFRS